MTDKPTLPDVASIVAAWLKANGYDGLFQPGQCSCQIDDLMPCGEPGTGCQAGYRAKCPFSPARNCITAKKGGESECEEDCA